MPLRKRQKIQEMLLSLIPASGCQSNPRQGLLYLYRLCLAWGGHCERGATDALSMHDLVPARWSQRSDFSRWQDRLRQQASGFDMGHGNEIQLILQGAFDIECHELFAGRTQTPPNRGPWR